MITVNPPPWKHQRDACSFIHRRKGSLIWVPMGGGKTRVVADYLQNTPDGPTLICCPLKVVPVWGDQLRRWMLHTRNILLLDKGSVAARAAEVAAMGANDIVVLNYDAARLQPMAGTLVKVHWQYIVMDECHRIKSPSGITSRLLAKLCTPCPKVIGLSGTPLSTGTRGKGGRLIGGWMDIYGQARAIAPGTFGYSNARFRARYGVWMTTPFPKLLDDINVAEFRSKMDSFCFHVTEEQLQLNLPETTDTIIPITLPAEVMRAYAALAEDLITLLGGEQVSASNALVKILRLQQMTGGFAQADGAETVTQIHAEKLDAAAELIEDMDPGERVVIFCKFRPEIKALGEVIKREIYHVMGGANTSEEWKRSSGGVLLVQIQAGSEGIDLTPARYGIYYSACHSLKDYQQSRKRLHRPGQRRPVTYYHLTAAGTIDDDIYAALTTKQDVVQSIKDTLKRRY